jgi:hypothetical protein
LAWRDLLQRLAPAFAMASTLRPRELVEARVTPVPALTREATAARSAQPPLIAGHRGWPMHRLSAVANGLSLKPPSHEPATIRALQRVHRRQIRCATVSVARLLALLAPAEPARTRAAEPRRAASEPAEGLRGLEH